MLNVFTIMELFAIGVIFASLIILLTDNDGSREQKMMWCFLCGCLVQNTGYLMEATAQTLDAAIVSVKMEYLGSIFSPLFYCWFIYGYCYRKPPKKLLISMAAIDFVLLALVFSLERHTIYYRKVVWTEVGGGQGYLSLSYGPGFVVFMVVGCILPFFLAMYVLLRTIRSYKGRTADRRYKTIFALTNVPMLALLLYVCNLTSGIDITPMVMGLTLSLVSMLIWRRKTYDFQRLASEVLLDNMSDGVIALDIKGRLFSYNRAAIGIFPELESHRIGDSIADIPNFSSDILAEGQNKEFCLHDRYYESHTQSILSMDNQVQGYVLLILDVTENRNYIEEIKRVSEQAKKANMAKSEFLANMSHEIRTPMNAIIGLSDIIMEESKRPEMYAYAGDIKSASQNLLALINDILDLSKVEAGKMELVTSDYYVKAVVNEIIHMMDMAASRQGILLKYEYDDSIPCCYHGDQGRIKQILINLLNNAIKFTKEGYVKITVGGMPGATEDMERLVFTIEDTGCGIKEEDQKKIFENFKQVDSSKNRSAEGTGLGLSITRHLVLLMGGTIELESVYGEGTVFTVTIPQKIIDAKTLAEVPEIPIVKSEKVELFTAPGTKALLVDDNLINRKVAKGFLNPYQMELTEAASGFEAVELVKENRYDIIFMDHMMPEMDGIEAVRIIRQECGDNGKTPVIIALTANVMEGAKERLLDSGFQDFLPKPMERKMLWDVLMKWIPEERRKECGGEEEAQELSELSIEGIDADAVKRNQAGSMDDYKELLQLYCLDGRRKLDLLRRLYEKKDYRTYEIEVHGLKSASANIGAMVLSAAAKEHEHAAGRGDTEFIDRHFTELADMYERQIRSIREFLDASPDGKKEDEELLDAPDRETLLQKVRQALDLLEHFHSKECAAQIEELLRYRLDTDMTGKLQEVQEQLKLYEDTLAEELLQRILDES